MLSTRRTNIIIAILLLAALVIKLSMVAYGLPYLFHPDEPYIFKDPFKILFKYTKLDFSSSTNLLFWAVTAWYALFFAGGLLTGHIKGLAEFQDLLAGEDASIILYGRLLSILLSLGGTWFILQIIKRHAKDGALFLLLGLTLILNPIELLSNLWIKFDPAVYFFACLLLNHAYRYFTGNEHHLRNRIYILSFIGLSLRVDLIAFMAAFVLLDFRRHRYGSAREFARARLRPSAIGMLAYLAITMLPFTLLLGSRLAASGDVGVTQPFESAIVSKYVQNFSLVTLLKIMFNNIGFYLVTCTLLTFGPLVFIPLFKEASDDAFSDYRKMILGFLAVLFIPLMFFGYFAPHYFSISALALLVLNFLFIAAIKNRKWRLGIAVFNLVFAGSISVQLILAISSRTDTRLEARAYILETTTKSDLIAIEKYLNEGFFPPVDECPEVLAEKIQAIKKYGMGTGETFRLKMQRMDTSACRNILEISAPKRFAGTAYEDRWAIDYDARLLLEKQPDFIISQVNYHKEKPGDFSSAIRFNYSIKEIFDANFNDARLQGLIAEENYFPPFYIYERLKKVTQ